MEFDDMREALAERDRLNRLHWCHDYCITAGLEKVFAVRRLNRDPAFVRFLSKLYGWAKEWGYLDSSAEWPRS